MEHDNEDNYPGLHPEARAAAQAAARAAGLSIEDWISRTILNVAHGSPPAVSLPSGDGTPSAPPAVTLPNQRAVEQAAAAAGMRVEDWLSRAVLESIGGTKAEGDGAAAINATPAKSDDHAAALPGFSEAGKESDPYAKPAEDEPSDAEKLAEIVNRSRESRPDRSYGGPAAGPVAAAPALDDSPPPLASLPQAAVNQSRFNPRHWAAGAAIAGLAAIAIGIWAMPSLPKLGIDITRGADVASRLPGADAKRTTEKLPIAGGKTAKRSIDPTLPEPSRTARELPKPAKQHVAWYERAAALGNTKAQVVLGDLYLRGEGVKQDYRKAADLFRKAAVDGKDPEGQFALATMLEKGQGVSRDEIEALLWYNRAAGAGHPIAMYRAGLIHAKGNRVPQNYTRARELYVSAAKNGVAPAMFELGKLTEAGRGAVKSKARAFDHYAAAATAGYKPAEAEIVRLTEAMSDEDIIRSKALPRPAERFVAWYKKAARLGKTQAQISLAKLYLRGAGVERDFASAAKLFREAGERGRDPDAQFSLAVMLERGMGVKQDKAEAFKWYQAAAKNGHARALLNVGFAYIKGDGVPQNYAKAREYFERAAKKNLAEAQYNLGLVYEHGFGVDSDVAMAFKWYSLAVANQQPEAGKALDRLIPKMSSSEIARAKQLLTERN